MNEQSKEEELCTCMYLLCNQFTSHMKRCSAPWERRWGAMGWKGGGRGEGLPASSHVAHSHSFPSEGIICIWGGEQEREG